MKRLDKVIAIVLTLVLTLQIAAPIGGLGLEETNTLVISSEVKDGSENVDFNYEFSLSNTFDLIYNKEKIEDYIKAYINNKIGTDYIVEVNKE